MKVLVSSGPVHAYLDPVKIITNRFKGGMMATIADRLQGDGADVTVLCSRGSHTEDDWIEMGDQYHDGALHVKIVWHDGFEDYRQKVRELAPEMDAVVLGAAVVNLIPVRCFMEGFYKHISGENEHKVGRVELWKPSPMPLTDKFPSHNYKPGDRIFMEWTIAPRIIDEVKAVMKPTAHLFGFKLLSGHSHDELIKAAYDVLLESRATCVFANDASSKDSLLTKYAVMKDRSIHKMRLEDVAGFVRRLLDDEYYRTDRVQTEARQDVLAKHDKAMDRLDELIEDNKDEFVEVGGGLVFGTVAVRVSEVGSFVTTARGKKELDGRVWVLHVDHDKRVITATNKATLNAPLLHWIFKMYPQVHSIMHFHRQEEDLSTYPYAPPGTKRDSVRGLACKSFNIEGHGCFLLRDEKGEAIR